MKKRYVILNLIFALALLCSVFIPNVVVYADTEPVVIGEDPPIEEEEEISETQAEINAKYELGYELAKNTDIADEGLYKALLSIVKDYALNVNGETFTGDTIYSEMLDNITTIEIGNKYNISSLAGMDKLELSHLETLSITRNALTSFDGYYLRNTTDKFTTLNLASNKISTFNLGDLEYLRDINVSANALRSIDLSGVEGITANTPITLNLAGNYFGSMNDIKLPTRRIGKITMNLISNNIVELDENYFNTAKYDISLGIQGVKSSDSKSLEIETLHGIRIYKSNVDGLSVALYKDTEESEIKVASYSDSDVVDGNYFTIDTKTLGVGEYRIDYMFGDELAYLKTDINRAYYTSSDFIIKPTRATHQLEFKGKMYDNLDKVTGAVKVYLDCEEGATIYYSVNGGDFSEYTGAINCNKGGNYSIRTYVKIGEYQSDIDEVYVKTSLNTHVSDGLMLALLLIVSITLFVVVVPIVSKKFFKHN